MESLKEFERLITQAAMHLELNVKVNSHNEWHVNMAKTHLVDAVTWAGQALTVRKKDDSVKAD